MLGTADRKPQPLARISAASARAGPARAPARAPVDAVSPYRFRFVTSPAALSAIGADWGELEIRAGSRFNYFQTFEWVSNWYRHVGAPDGAELMILTARRDGRLEMVWPLMVVRQNGLRVVKWLSEPHLQYGDVLAADGPGLTALLDDAWSLIQTRGHHDVIALGKVLSTARVHSFLKRRCPVACNASAASQLDLSGFDSCQGFLKALGRPRRKRHTQRYNRIAKLGDLDFTVHLGGEAQARVVAQAFVFKRDWLEQNGLLSQTVFEAESARFIASLSTPVGDRPQMAVAEMTLDGAPIAIEIGFIFKRHYYAYMGAFDWAWREHSPGKVQMREMICWCINNGMDQYDFLGTPAAYKSEWTDLEIGMRDFCAPATLRGAVYARLWLARLRPLAKAAFERLTPARRRAVLGTVGRLTARPRASA
ncbi:MAG: GNAT family N-acetyltransferase [Hyphomicrobiales bacterium]